MEGSLDAGPPDAYPANVDRSRMMQQPIHDRCGDGNLPMRSRSGCPPRGAAVGRTLWLANALPVSNRRWISRAHEFDRSVLASICCQPWRCQTSGGRRSRWQARPQGRRRHVAWVFQHPRAAKCALWQTRVWRALAM